MTWPETAPGVQLPPSAMAAATRPAGLRDCARCGTAFVIERGKGPDRLYCSWMCAKAESQRLARERGQRTCLKCGGEIPAHRDLTAIYCSVTCNVAEQRARARKGMIYARECDLCGQPFESAQPAARFCCRDHAIKAGNNRRRNLSALPPRPRTDTERMSDLGVAFPAMKRGEIPARDAQRRAPWAMEPVLRAARALVMPPDPDVDQFSCCTAVLDGDGWSHDPACPFRRSKRAAS